MTLADLQAGALAVFGINVILVAAITFLSKEREQLIARLTD